MPRSKMTKGKIVLEMVKYAKSAVRKFRPNRGLLCGHLTEWTKDAHLLTYLTTIMGTRNIPR